jgi:aspartyl-tRNA(Asn)/glutamyl-tRNA(Gln) amidotransferase subunit A
MGWQDSTTVHVPPALGRIYEMSFRNGVKYSFLILPSTPGTAFPLGGKSNDPIQMYLEDIYTVQANICGVPAISIPGGTHSNGLPFGVQLVADIGMDASLLAFAARLQAKISQ